MSRGSTTAPDASEQLEAIKRLLVFGLLRSGATQKEVATALGTDQSVVSRMFGGALRQTVKTRRGK